MILSEKHKAAADHLLLDLADGTCGCGECRDMIARALAQAERDGMKHAAEIARTEGVSPETNVAGGGGEWYRHGQRIASAILSEAGED